MNGRLPEALPAFFRYFMAKRKWAFVVLMLAPATHILETNIFPYALKWLVDEMTSLDKAGVKALAPLLPPIALYFGVWVGWIIIWRSQEWVYTSTIPAFQSDVRMAVFGYVQGHSHQFFADNFAGSIAAKISDLPRSMALLLEIIRWRFVNAASVTVTGIIMMAWVSPVFSCILGAWVIVKLGICYAFSGRVSRASAAHADDRHVLQGHIVDSLTNNQAARLFARSLFEMSFVGKAQKVEEKSNRRALREMWLLRMIFEIPAFVMGVAMMTFLVKGWMRGEVGLGDVVFILYTSFGILGAMWMMGNEIPALLGEISTCRQALSLVSRPHSLVDKPGAENLAVSRGKIEFDRVHFHYAPGRDIFRDKNLVINPGEKIGLVGFSGSGKSTFVNLILRLYDVESGRILIDGQDIAGVTQESLRRAIAMIPQDTALFHRSLMENIRYGRENATDAEVTEASRAAHCHEFIEQLEQGYDTLVGERGVKLSGGQRQRIAIARAMLKNAPVLILDEATSSLDSVTEKYIQESLDKMMQGRTTIVIAHRLSTLSRMDRILVFQKGQVVEDGTHEALLTSGGHYAMLWNMQAGGFLPDGEEG